MLNTSKIANGFNVMMCLCKLSGFIGGELYSSLNHIGEQSTLNSPQEWFI